MFRGLAAACTLSLAATAEPFLEIDSDVVWTEGLHYFGGFSGIEISPDGQIVTILSDQGYFLRAQVQREAGAITGFLRNKIVSVNDKGGNRVKAELTDSEGFAVDPSGAGYVSFEEHHRVMSVNLVDGIATLLPSHPDFTRFEINAGLEALAIHPNGTLYTLPETTALEEHDFPLYALERNRWVVVEQIPRVGPFLPVGADFSDDGLLYLLERAATPLGFRSRIRRFDLSAPGQSATTLLETTPGQLDNMEALTLWTDPSGQTRVVLLADDNYLNIQRTQVVEFILRE